MIVLELKCWVVSFEEVDELSLLKTRAQPASENEFEQAKRRSGTFIDIRTEQGQELRFKTAPGFKMGDVLADWFEPLVLRLERPDVKPER